MDTYLLTLAVIVGLAAGLLIYRRYRSVFAAVFIPLATVGSLSVLLLRDFESTDRISSGEARIQMPTLASLEQLRPVEIPSDGYVGSDACRECHAHEHKTWHASYHRTMTQVACPDTVIGDFDDRNLSYDGFHYHLQTNGEICWVDVQGQSLGNNSVSAQTSAAIVMTTGSHHMQAYWFGTGEGRVTGILPWVFLKETEEWIPRAAAFLRANHETEFEIGRWNTVCAKCHSTHHRERLQAGASWDTHVSEFGISCEACHGPGQSHIEFQNAFAEINDPAANLPDADDPIVNPAMLGKKLSSQVCGQCHSIFSLVANEAVQLNQQGHAYRPGRDLTETHMVAQRNAQEWETLHGDQADVEHQLNQLFYRDGMVRVSGREYNGLIESACYQHGEMSCLTCHKMHKSNSDSRSLSQWANDQLRPDAFGDAVCLDCHLKDQYATTQHTHHQIGSSGSSCYNCHMPHTTYGLLKAIRSHTISSPDVGKDIAAGRPNACNLCHLDKTLQWTADKLHQWYDIPNPDLDQDQRAVAASLLWLLKGDAAQRALAAWSMGWAPAQRTAGTAWATPYLAQLLDDPYLAIRMIARTSLRTLDGLSNLEVELFGSRNDRQAMITSIARHWQQNRPSSSIDRSELLFMNDRIQLERVQQLIQQRDNTSIYLAE